MPTSFPSSLDSLTNPNGTTDYLDTVPHGAQHANANDAIEALEAKVGADSSAVTTSHDYKLSEITSTDKAVGETATQTLTNKTLTAPTVTTPAITTPSFSGVYSGWVGAGETWEFGSWDSAAVTGVINTPSDARTKYSVGMRIRISQATGGTKYGIITVVAETALTVYFGTDYTLNNETVSSPFYSSQKAPFGFPLDPLKWSVKVTDTTERSQATPTALTWYNVGGSVAQIVVPIGSWHLSYFVRPYCSMNAGGTLAIASTLSTDDDSETDFYMTCVATISIGGATSQLNSTVFHRSKFVTLAAKATHYLNLLANKSAGTLGTLYSENQDSPLILQAVCAYL
jgi:hypothetical protein